MKLNLEVNGDITYYIPKNINTKGLTIQDISFSAPVMIEVFRIEDIYVPIDMADILLTHINGIKSKYKVQTSAAGGDADYTYPIDGTGKIINLVSDIEEMEDIILDTGHNWIIQFTLADDSLAVEDMGHIKFGLNAAIDKKSQLYKPTSRLYQLTIYSREIRYLYYYKDNIDAYYLEYEDNGTLKTGPIQNANGTAHSTVIEVHAVITNERLVNATTGETIDETKDILIYTSQEFMSIGIDPDYPIGENYALQNNLDFSGISGYRGIEEFTGTFDGLGFEIQNLTISQNTDNIGLFGVNKGTITNVGIDENSSITNTVGNNTGGLLGNNNNIGTVTNCYSKATISGNTNVGGLVGFNGTNGIIENSYTTGNVTGINNNIGGIAGNNNRIILNCYATGDITGANNNVGGFVGTNKDEILNSYATGNVSGVTNIGGFVGQDNTKDEIMISEISNSYATGDIDGVLQVGKIIGKIEGTTTNTASYDASIYTGDGLGYNGEVELTATELNTKSIHDGLIDEIDFDTTKVDSGFYPYVYQEGTTTPLLGQTDNSLPTP